jgi:esterase/lipase superfamily enzyme
MARTGRLSFFLMLLLAGLAGTAEARDCAGGGAHPARIAIPLFYVTDRNDLGTGEAVRWGRDSDHGQHYGLVGSSITRSCATLPAVDPLWWPAYTQPIAHHADAHFLIHDDRPYADEAGMLAAINDSLDAFQAGGGGPRDVILFIHGFNQSFPEAARDAAQLALDLPFRGAAVFYSWPSQDSLLHYQWDATRLERAQPFIRELIRDIVDRVHPDHLHILAHSMGNRALIAALLDLARERTDLGRRISSITLLSPDIDQIAFERLTDGRFGRIAGRITLLVNARDRALGLSRHENGGTPLGLLRDVPFVAAGVTTIDISPVSHSLTGHSDFEQEAAVMREIEAGISGVPIGERHCLERIEASAGPYYRIDPARPDCPQSGGYRPSP